MKKVYITSGPGPGRDVKKKALVAILFSGVKTICAVWVQDIMGTSV